MMDRGHAVILIEPRKEVFPGDPLRLFLRQMPRTITRADPCGLRPAAHHLILAVDLILAPAELPPAALLIEVAGLLQLRRAISSPLGNDTPGIEVVAEVKRMVKVNPC